MNKLGYEITEGDRSIFKNGEFNSGITNIEYLKKAKKSSILTIGSRFYEFIILNN